MVCRCGQARRARCSTRRARATSASSPRRGRRPGSTGSRTSSRGASRASCGGVTGFRPGTADLKQRTAMILEFDGERRRSLPRPRRGPQARNTMAEERSIGDSASRDPAGSLSFRRRRPLHLARRGRARHLVLLRPLALRHARLARADRRPQAPLPQRRAHLGLRHPVLLGRAHGDAGHRVHGRAAVEDALSPRPGPRRARARKCPSPRAIPSTRSA